MSMMMSDRPPEREQRRRRVFISYSWADSDQVDLIERAVLSVGLDVWRDKNEISVGEIVADKIKEALNASDYYLIFVSENSARSAWVRREVAYAFQLSLAKKTTIIPVLAGEAELPFEFSGYLYIDFRKSFADGLSKLVGFFKSQSEPAGAKSFKPNLPSPAKQPGGPGLCIDKLERAKLGNLRHAMSDCLTIDQVAVMWFDVFERRMEDEVNKPNVALACVELIDRARREGEIAELLKIICRNAPKVSNHPNLFD